MPCPHCKTTHCKQYSGEAVRFEQPEDPAVQSVAQHHRRTVNRYAEAFTWSGPSEIDVNVMRRAWEAMQQQDIRRMEPIQITPPLRRERMTWDIDLALNHIQPAASVTPPTPPQSQPSFGSRWSARMDAEADRIADQIINMRPGARLEIDEAIVDRVTARVPSYILHQFEVHRRAERQALVIQRRPPQDRF